MRPIATNVVAWYVCMSVCWSCSLALAAKTTVQTDRDAVWVADSGGPKEPSIR